jgi:hypothetical protein
VGLLDRLLAPWRQQAAAAAPSTPAEPLLDLPLLADLPVRREQATEAVHTARTQEAFALGGTFGGDPDDGLYRRLTTGVKMHHRDLTPLQQDRMTEIAWFLFEQNPLAKRLITLTSDLVVGGGVTVEAEDERLQVVIDKVWTGRINQLESRAREFHNALGITGELILPVAVNPITGGLQLGYLDPAQIEAIIPLPGNVLVPQAVRLKSERMGGGGDGRELTIVRENPATGRLEGECFYLGINKLPNSLRGRSDLLAYADWIDMYDSFMMSEVERIHLQSSFVWDYKIEGADAATIKDKLANLPTPKAGQVFGHNEKETLEARTPDLKAVDRSAAGRMMLTHIIGSFGFPLTYFGFTDSNNATIQGQNDVMLRTPAARQIEYRTFLETIVRFAVEQATSRNPALFRDASEGFKVRMPEIQAKDVSRVGQVFSQVVSALDTAMANKTASRQLAVTVTVGLLKHLGIEADPNTVIAQADAEADERQEMADLIAAGVARDRARRGPSNAPVPNPDDPNHDPDPDDVVDERRAAA